MSRSLPTITELVAANTLASLLMDNELLQLVMIGRSLVGSGGTDLHYHCHCNDQCTCICSFSSHGKQKGILAAEFAEKKLSALAPSIEKQNEALAAYSIIDITQGISRYRQEVV